MVVLLGAARRPCGDALVALREGCRTDTRPRISLRLERRAVLPVNAVIDANGAALSANGAALREREWSWHSEYLKAHLFHWGPGNARHGPPAGRASRSAREACPV